MTPLDLISPGASTAYGLSKKYLSDPLRRSLTPESYYAEKIEEQQKNKARKQTIAAVSTVIGVGLLGLVVAKRVF
mgnify:CR=1 FL=1